MGRCTHLARCKRYPMRDADLRVDTERDVFDAPGGERPMGSSSVEKKAVLALKTDERLREKVDDRRCAIDYVSVHTGRTVDIAALENCPGWYWDVAKIGRVENLPAAERDYSRSTSDEEESGALNP